MENNKILTVETGRLNELADELISKYDEWHEYQIDITTIENPGSLIHNGTVPILIAVINECAIIFPNDWKRHPTYGYAYYKGDELKNPCTSAMIYFQINYMMFKHLFVPQNQFTNYFGGTILNYNGTPAEVGYNIKSFIANYKTIMN